MTGCVCECSKALIPIDPALEELRIARKRLKFIKERLDTLAESANDKAVRAWAEAAIVTMGSIRRDEPDD